MKEQALSLLTDLYQLTMASTYYRKNHTGKATFSLFIRKYPDGRSYFVSDGLEDALDFVRSSGFEQDEYPVRLSDGANCLQEQIVQQVKEKELGEERS